MLRGNRVGFPCWRFITLKRCALTRLCAKVSGENTLLRIFVDVKKYGGILAQVARERILSGWRAPCGSRSVPQLVIPALRKRILVWEHSQCGCIFASRDSPAGCFERILSGRRTLCGSILAPQPAEPAEFVEFKNYRR